MPRFTRAIGAMIVGFLLLLLGPVATATADSHDLDDFTFASLDAVYELGHDSEGRSTLRTTATYVAEFPEHDQNRGLRIALPEYYDGHPTDLEIVAVTDAEGAPRGYEAESDDDRRVITIADENFVHGTQTYVIEYTQQNVTHVPDDAGIDEFYWDVNGLGWAQPFERVRAELELAPEIAAAYTGDAACYQGAAGDAAECDRVSGAEAGTESIIFEAEDLGPHENLSIAAAFEPETFVPRDDSFGASTPAVLGAFATALTVLLMLAAIALRLTRWRSAPRRRAIIAQYEPPSDISVLTAADLVNAASKGITATVLDRAVAGDVRIVETDDEKFAVDYLGEARRSRTGDDSEVLGALFGEPLSAPARRDLAEQDSTLATALYKIVRRVRRRAPDDDLRRRVDTGLRATLILVAVLSATASVIFGAVALVDARGGAWPAVLFITAVLGAVVTGAFVFVRPLTRRGRTLRTHLAGLELFIELAEADRIRMLQSPDGALRGDVESPSGRARVVQITERLLPYAVIFGHEKQWIRELSALYASDDGEPGWYSGRSAFDAVIFASAVSSFATTSTASWSGTSSSSSGSGGGGFSGGGGGGGGGGGV